MTRTKTGSWIEYWDSQASFDPMMHLAAERFFSRTRDLVGFAPDEVVLDIGCGTGALEERLAGTGCEIHGVDTSVAMVSRCRERFGSAPNMHFHALDPERYTDLSFLPASHFTRIICLSVVQYYRSRDDLPRLLQSISRLARPGAVCLIADIPTDSRPVADAVELLRNAAAGRFIGPAMRLLFASLFSQYGSLRRSTGILHYAPDFLAQVTRESPAPARILTDPLTLNHRRVHLEIRFPEPEEEHP